PLARSVPGLAFAPGRRERLSWAGSVRRRREVRTAESLVSAIVARLPGEASSWTAHPAPRTLSDACFVPLGPNGCPPTAALKVPYTVLGALSLRREIDVLERLGCDPRLGTWRALLPEVIAAGEVDGQPYLVERLVSGVD